MDGPRGLMDGPSKAHQGSVVELIVVTRLAGSRFAVNPDLVQRIDATPDTVLTLVDGTKYIVAEGFEEIVAAITEYRARVIARAQEVSAESAVLDDGPGAHRGQLSVVPNPSEGH